MKYSEKQIQIELDAFFQLNEYIQWLHAVLARHVDDVAYTHILYLRDRLISGGGDVMSISRDRDAYDWWAANRRDELKDTFALR